MWLDYYDKKELETFYNKTVVKIEPKNSDDVRIYLEDGTIGFFTLSAGCCSSSDYTDPDQFNELIGSKIINMEERFNRSEDFDDGNIEDKWHFLVFTTDKGHVTIDWRNRSNGYYDGSVELTIIPTL